MRRRFDGKTVLAIGVGGAFDARNRSIGQAVAVSFAREGAAIMIVDLSSEGVESTRQLVIAEGGSCIGYSADATDPSAVAALVTHCRRELGPINILYNNLGIMRFGPTDQLPVEDWDKVMDVNVRAPFLTSREVLPDMISARGGAIVNVSSVAGCRWTGARYVPYNASKAAIIGFTRALALEYASVGIRVNCVVPGYVDSPMMRGGIEQRLGTEAVETEVARRHAACPLGRLASGWDVAHAVLFLASDEAAYITGASLPVDGGVSLDAAL